LPSAAEDRVRAQIDEAGSLLDAGRSREAADIFGRVLLLDPDRDDARRGLERARAALAEERRRTDGRLEEARHAIQAGDREAARVLLEQVIERGGDRDRAHALLDRLDRRAGRIHTPPLRFEGEGALEERPRLPRSRRWRQVVVGAWTVVFVTAAVGLAFSWEQFVGSLVRNPTPTTTSLPRSAGEPRRAPGDESLALARRLMERGDPAAALHVLDGVSPVEPAYPFARELREQAVRAMERSSASR
jgi:tetratricopeptide (TPR) repeat protein